MTYKAEVRDRGGCQVGTAVYLADSLTCAVRWVGETSRQEWAGSWTIAKCDGEITTILLRGAA